MSDDTPAGATATDAGDVAAVSSRPRGLLVVWHSRTGASAALARAVAAGALAEAGIVESGDGRNDGRDEGRDGGRAQGCAQGCDEGTTVRLVAARTAGAADLLGAAGYVFVAPEMLGALSGVMKDFFDRTYYPVLDRIAGRPYACLIAAGSDGHGAVRQIERIATGWRLRPVAAAGIVRVDAQTPEAILARKRLRREQVEPARALGAALAAGLAMGVF